MWSIGQRKRTHPNWKRVFRPCLEALESRLLLSGDAVLRWNGVALDAVAVDHQLGGVAANFGPTPTARALAIVHAAIYDAVNAIDQTYTSYLTDVVAPPGTSLDAAVARAGHDTLAALYPDQNATFDDALATDLAAIPDGPGEDDGVALGSFVAGRILTQRAHDGSQDDMSYMPGTDPGDWQPDPLHPTEPALTPGWGAVTPFALASGAQFRSPPPPALDSPEYQAALDEVKPIGGDGTTTASTRTAEQTQIGIFWGYDGQPAIGTPPRLYNQIARVLAEQQGNTEVQNARFFALVNIALADAGIAAWDVKYTYSFWRPVTAIRATSDPLWTPLGAHADNGSGTNFTPPFPAYTSGHATFGAALFQMLANIYGRDDIPFTIGSDEFNGVTTDAQGNVRPVLTRSFTRFSQAAEENGQSRIYLGIHWKFDKEQGIALGKQVADYTFQHFLRSRLTPHQRFVHQVYHDLLGRTPDTLGLGYWSLLLEQGMSRTDVARMIAASPEYQTRQIEEMYSTYLQRDADAAGMTFFVNQLTEGATLAQVRAQIIGSTEYLQRRAAGQADQFLDVLYADMLGRSVDAAGKSFFETLMDQGMSRSQVAEMMDASLEFQRGLVGTSYQQFLRRTVDDAGLDYFVDKLQEGDQEEDLVAGLLGSGEYFAKM